MTEWWAELVGNEQELKELEVHLADSEHRIIKKGKYYYLKIEDEQEDFDPDILHDHMSRLVAMLNGAAKLRFHEFTGVKSYSVIRFKSDGKRVGYGFATAPKVPSTLYAPVPPDGVINTWVSLGNKSDFIERALTLYGALEHNWKNLYLVLEVIEDDLGGEVAVLQKKFVSNRKLKSFKNTANSFRAIGRDARHATTRYSLPRSPMLITVAQELIHTVLEKWLESKK